MLNPLQVKKARKRNDRTRYPATAKLYLRLTHDMKMRSQDDLPERYTTRLKAVWSAESAVADYRALAQRN